MKLLQPNDYVIWKKRKLCRIVSEVTRGPAHFLGLERPIAERYASQIHTPGLSADDITQSYNDTSTWVVRDDKTGEEFQCNGFDLVYVNEMKVLAFMARNDDT